MREWFKRNWIAKVLLICFMLCFWGCASMCNHQTSAVQCFRIEQEGAKIQVRKNGTLLENDEDSTSFTLHSSDGYFIPAHYDFRISAPGYEPQTFDVAASLSGYYWLNFLTLIYCPIGFFITDPASGAMYKISGGTIDVDLQKSTNGVTQTTYEADIRAVDDWFGIALGSDVAESMKTCGLLPMMDKDDGSSYYYDLGDPNISTRRDNRRVVFPGSHSLEKLFFPRMVFVADDKRTVRTVMATMRKIPENEFELNRKAVGLVDKWKQLGLGEPEYVVDKYCSTWCWVFKDFKKRNCFANLLLYWQSAKYERGMAVVLGLLPEDVGKKNSARKHSVDAKSMSGVFRTAKNCLALISSGKGRASGFIAKDGDKCYLYTNEHVTRGGEPFSAKLISGEKIELGQFEIAKDRDVVRFEVSSGLASCKVADGIPDIGESVIVFGNSDGAGVATELVGSVLGVGPDRIETDAKFVRGNSGSPVLNKKSEVVGIVTHATKKSNGDWVMEGTRFVDVRRFAARVDNVEWEKVPWSLYVRMLTTRPQ